MDLHELQRSQREPLLNLNSIDEERLRREEEISNVKNASGMLTMLMMCSEKQCDKSKSI